MSATDRPVPRPPTARLLHIDQDGGIHHTSRVQLAQLLRPGDLVIANDAATLPAGFALDWRTLAEFKARGIEFATLTQVAGICSTGDAKQDRLLPFDEAYRIPVSTEQAIAAAWCDERRIVAIGATVVRALEHSAAIFGSVAAGESVANNRIGPHTRLRVVSAILTDTHEPGTSHYQLLQAFADKTALRRADDTLGRAGYRTHEFGDSVLIERDSRRYSRATCRPAAAGVFREMQGLVGRPAPRILRGFAPASAHVVQESHRLSPARRLLCLRD